MNMRRWSLFLCLLVVAVPLAGCARPWELTVQVSGGATTTLGSREWQELARAHPQQVREGEALALERVLWFAGANVVEAVRVAGQDYAWQDVCADSWLLKSGALRLAGQTVTADTLVVTPPARSARLRLIDLTPTIAGALGVRSPTGTRGQALAAFKAPQVIVVAIDGLSYLAFQDVARQGITPLLDGLAEPKLLRSTYPSSSDAAMLAALCGTEAEFAAGQPRPETLFDVLAEADRPGVAVLPQAPAVDLGAAQVVLVEPPDAQADVTAVAIDAAVRALEERSPALLWLQLDGLARAAASYGLATDATTARLAAIDGQLHRLIAEAPAGALLLIVGTHGVHPTTEGGALAASGTLLPSDMLVPLWVVEL